MIAPDSVPLKYVAGINLRKLDEGTDPDLEIRYVDIGSVGRGALIEEPEAMRFETAPSRARRLVEPGDVIVSTVRTYLGAVLPIQGSVDDLVVSTGFAVITPQAIEPGFLGWYLQSVPFVDEVVARSTGVSYPAINPSVIGDIDVPLPPAVTQRAIADFLDTETARIDALIAKKRRLIDLLDQRTVARAQRDTKTGSGIPARRLLAAIRTGTTPGGEDASFIRSDGQVEWISPGDVASGLLITKAARYLDRAAMSRKVVPVFPAGSCVVIGIGATAGRVGFVDREMSGNQQMTCLVPRPDALDGRFLAWQLLGRTAELRSTAPFTTLPILNNEFVRSLILWVPRLKEQRRIARNLDADLALTTRTRAALEAQVALLQEHRQALITAAVTGELPVPEVAA